MKQLVNLDEKNQIMTSSSTLSLSWSDWRLVWQESDFGHVSEILIPMSLLWKLDLYVINSANANGFISIPGQSLAIVQNDGSIFVVLSLVNLRTRCDINIKTYPFDTQKCPVSKCFLNKMAKLVYNAYNRYFRGIFERNFMGF